MKGTATIFVAFLLFVFLTQTNGDIYQNSREVPETKSDPKANLGIKGEIQGLFMYLNEMFSNGTLTNLSFVPGVRRSCLLGMETVNDGILKGESNALDFLYAEFKPGSGLIEDRIAWTGDYALCLSTELNANFSSTAIHGKYFSVLLELNGFREEPTILVGICLPAFCNETETKALLTNTWRLNGVKNVTIKSVYDVSKPVTFTPGSKSSISLLIAILVIVSIGTGVDIYHRNTVKKNQQPTSTDALENQLQPATDTNIGKEDKTADTDENTPLLNMLAGKTNSTILCYLKSFSVLTNTMYLYNFQPKERFASFSGIKVLSNVWFLLCQTYFFCRFSYQNQKYAVSTLNGRWSYHPIANGSFSIDSLFFIGGLLVSLHTLVEMRLKGRINWIRYFVFRIWRVLPSYSFIVFLYTTLLPSLVHGPFRWYITEDEHFSILKQSSCCDRWFSNLLFINNLYPEFGDPKKACMEWTWYFALDMQFYMLIAPPVLLLLHKKKLAGIIVSLLMIISCVVVRACLAVALNMTIFEVQKIYPDYKITLEEEEYLYRFPFARWSPYLLGILTGFMLVETRARIKIKTSIKIFCWLISTAVGIFVVYQFGLYDYEHGIEASSSRFGTRVYVAVSRTLFSICLCWVSLACMTGQGGWINAILSWKGWFPLRRLCNGAFLLHPILLIVVLFNRMENTFFSEFLMICIFLGCLFAAYLLSYITFITVEMPFRLTVAVTLDIFSKRQIKPQTT